MANKYFIDLDFIGKDSVHDKRSIEVPKEIYDLYQEVWSKASKNGELFDKANSATVSAFLKEIIPNASPKVLRTAKCNEVLIKNLKAQKDKNGNPISKSSTEAEKLNAIYKANLEIAKQLNHQKNVSKNFKAQEQKSKDRVTDSKKAIKEFKAAMTEKIAKLDEQAAAAKKRYANQPATKKTKLSEIKAKKEKLQLQLEKKIQASEKAQARLTKQQETKDIALGTSLANYADPKVIKSWCKYVDLPIEKVFNKSLLTAFAEADADENYWLSII